MLRCPNGGARRLSTIINSLLREGNSTLAHLHGGSMIPTRSYQHKPFPERQPVDRPQNTDYSSPSIALSRREKRRTRADYRNPKFKIPEVSGKTSVSAQSLLLELKWVQDRVALANRVEELLRDNDYDKAKELTRAAQKNKIECVVAWNTIFEYLMDRNQPMVAFKLYNDMKKAGTKPNSRTYTIMFSGLANSSSPNAVKIAYSIYRSLSKSGSETKPLTIHHNALLEVCARHGNLEGLWRIIEELPESGPGSPDARTYTIILNAIRAGVDKETVKMNQWSQKDGILVKRRKAMNEAKGIWAIVLNQWRKGQLFIDSHLVVSMGKLLQFTENDGNCWDVFRLYNQTMGIPLPNSKVNKALLSSALGRHSNPPKEDDNFEGIFDEVDLKEVTKSAEQVIGEKLGVSHSKPTNLDLSLLLQTCQTMTNALGISIGRYYWDLLTDSQGKYKVTPDSGSFHDYLRLLRVARNSREAYRAIVQAQERTPGILSHKTFIIAMSTCERDRNNPNVFMIASKLLELMEKTQRIPEPRVLMRYAELTEQVTTQEQLKSRLAFERSKRPEDKESGRFTTNEITLFKFTHTEALRILRPHITRIKQLLAYGKVCAGTADQRISLEENEGEILDKQALRSLSSGEMPPGCKLDIDQAVHALISVRRLHITLLNPKLCNLTQDATDWYKQESERLRRFIEPRRLFQAPFKRTVSIEEEEQEQRSRENANDEVTPEDRATIARMRSRAAQF